MSESEMPGPRKFHCIKRLPPGVFADVVRLMRRAGEILPEYSQVEEAGA